MESDHLEGEDLHPKVGRSPKDDRQVDLPKWYGLLPRHDAVEGCPVRLDVQTADAHSIEGVDVDDVEATASIHQHLREPLGVDDGVDY